MRFNRFWSVMAATLLIVGLSYAGARAAGALQAQPTSVAVVDLARVFENLREQQQVKADLLQRQEGLKTQLQDKRKQIETLQGDLDLMSPGSAPYLAKQNEIEKATIDVQVWSEFEARKLRAEEQVLVEGLVRKANAAVERVAKEQGYDLVMYKNQTVNMRGNDPGQQAQLNIRMVAWNSDTIELTDQVIQRMNNEFQAGTQ